MTEAQLNTIAMRLLWVAIALGLLMFTCGCHVPPAHRRKAAPKEVAGVRVHQFRILTETTVHAQHVEKGSTVQLTLPRGCVVTVAAQETEDGPKVMALRKRQ